jgi:hypothetical protein
MLPKPRRRFRRLNVFAPDDLARRQLGNVSTIADGAPGAYLSAAANRYRQA